jgi:hypothetical protein
MSAVSGIVTCAAKHCGISPIRLSTPLTTFNPVACRRRADDHARRRDFVRRWTPQPIRALVGLTNEARGRIELVDEGTSGDRQLVGEPPGCRSSRARARPDAKRAKGGNCVCFTVTNDVGTVSSWSGWLTRHAHTASSRPRRA